ncbi:MAG TPA: hypothetical protein VFF43_04765 [Caldimonas sp.]|nr:hypothetical protein [Caldimonas sp.]
MIVAIIAAMGFFASTRRARPFFARRFAGRSIGIDFERFAVERLDRTVLTLLAAARPLFAVLIGMAAFATRLALPVAIGARLAIGA